MTALGALPMWEHLINSGYARCASGCGPLTDPPAIFRSTAAPMDSKPASWFRVLPSCRLPNERRRVGNDECFGSDRRRRETGTPDAERTSSRHRLDQAD